MSTKCLRSQKEHDIRTATRERGADETADAARTQNCVSHTLIVSRNAGGSRPQLGGRGRTLGGRGRDSSLLALGAVAAHGCA